MLMNSDGSRIKVDALRTLFLPLVLIVLTACSDGDNRVAVNSQPGNDQPGNDPTGDPGAGVANPDTGDCTYELTSDITSPTELVNTSAYCDYRLDGWVEVKSLLQIQPGVVVRADSDARIVLEGGEIQAIGTADQRIVFEGASHVQGFWRGIDIREGRGAYFDYVDVKDGGQVCSVLFCPDVGLMVEDITFSFTNSSVSNSYVIGMSIDRDVDIVAFANNRFYGNALSGLAIDAEQVPELDAASDYLGVGNENGIAAVDLHSGSQTLGKVFEWKDLNAPYFIDSYLNVENGTLRLLPGVELLFGSEAWMTIDGNGVFQSLGTAANPVTIKGLKEQPGYWDGIRFNDSPWDSNQLQYTTISHSGNVEGLTSAYAAINLDESTVTLSNSTISDNERWGIVCNDPDFPYDPSIIVDDGGNSFSNNSSGHIDSDCTLQ